MTTAREQCGLVFRAIFEAFGDAGDDALEPSEDWLMALSTLSQAQIAFGIACLRNHPPADRPGCVEFVRLCRPPARPRHGAPVRAPIAVVEKHLERIWTYFPEHRR